MISRNDEHEKTIPYLLGIRKKPELFFQGYCPYCRCEHNHGQGDGHRVSHCGSGESPFDRGGYELATLPQNTYREYVRILKHLSLHSKKESPARVINAVYALSLASQFVAQSYGGKTFKKYSVANEQFALERAATQIRRFALETTIPSSANSYRYLSASNKLFDLDRAIERLRRNMDTHLFESSITETKEGPV